MATSSCWAKVLWENIDHTDDCDPTGAGRWPSTGISIGDKSHHSRSLYKVVYYVVLSCPMPLHSSAPFTEPILGHGTEYMTLGRVQVLVRSAVLGNGLLASTERYRVRNSARLLVPHAPCPSMLAGHKHIERQR